MTEQIIIFFQIVFIDLVLAGDNAIIIGMVASQFPIKQRKKIIFFGIGIAVILRIIFTLITAYLLQITGLRLIGGILLLYICYKLYVDVVKDNSKDNKGIKVNKSNFLKANILIVLEGHVDIENDSMIMWKVFNNLDPKRDFYFNGDRLGVDATKKYKEEGYQQNWPEEIEMSEEIKTRVDSKWNSMFGK